MTKARSPERDRADAPERTSQTMRAAPSIDPDAFERPTAPPPDGLFALDELGDHLASTSDVPTADDEFGRVFESGVLPRGSLSAPRVPSFGDDEPSGLRAAVAPSQPVVEKTRDELLEEMVAEIGLTSRPRRSVDNAELQRMSLDHRGGFLMSCVDGRSTVEEILDIAGMDPFDALQILVRLKRRGAIEL